MTSHTPSRVPRVALCVALALGAGCTSNPPSIDASIDDASAPDSAHVDGGARIDAATNDVGTDAGIEHDAGAIDAATNDAATNDAATNDAATFDAATNDAATNDAAVVDAWMASCGNGTLDAGEVCDDGNTVSGDGCDANCTPTACGNGVVSSGEHCDDGNTISGDGCHADCVSETEIEPNEDGTPSLGGTGRQGNDFDAVAVAKADANGVIHDTFVMHAAWAVPGDEDVFALENTGDTAEVFTIETASDVPSSCSIDTVITIRDATAAQFAQDDDSGTNNCSLLRYVLAPHTRVYVHITDYGDNDTTSAYVIYFSLCGDSFMGPGEVCDDGNPIDGDTCDPNCTIPACGNGIVDPTELCDDGNLTSGDGCDANCTPTACGNGIPTTGEVCDDGNATSGDGCDVNCTISACGNGVTAGTEACDDGNAVDGDGCDSNCTVTACGNGIATAGEACDDGNLVSGDGCEPDCTVSPTCGNGMIDAGEACDDANGFDGDGCTSACGIETGWTCSGAPSVCVGICGDGVVVGTESCDDANAVVTDCCVACSNLCSTAEVEPDDASSTATTITTGARGSITPNDHDYFAITLTATSNVRIETFDGTGGGCATGTDTYAQLFATDGTTVLASDDDSGIGACSLIDPLTVTAARSLPPGTYYVMVRAYSATSSIAAYEVRVTITPSGCGDAIIATPEQCDDGNAIAGDGCSATCQIEGVVSATETEPNDDGTPSTGGTGIVGNDIDATAIANANTNGAIAVSTIITAALTPAGDEDLYAVTNTTAGPLTLRAETGAPTIGTCPTGTDTGLRVLDASLAVIATDDDGGPGACSLVAAVTIPAGVTYYVQVVEYGDNAVISPYQLYLRLQ